MGWCEGVISFKQAICVIAWKQLFVRNKKWRQTIQMTNKRPAYILPLVNYNVYWSIIGHLYCMTVIIYL